VAKQNVGRRRFGGSRLLATNHAAAPGKPAPPNQALRAASSPTWDDAAFFCALGLFPQETGANTFNNLRFYPSPRILVDLFCLKNLRFLQSWKVRAYREETPPANYLTVVPEADKMVTTRVRRGSTVGPNSAATDRLLEG
jgi:hypothetical protein